MCEYCGCQSVAAIGDLTREHDAVVGLIAEVRAAAEAGDVVAVAGLARTIAAMLGPHTAVEEYGLFPALVDEFGEQVATLEAEHRHIETVLAEAATGTPADPAWPARLMTVLHVLREHILKEQDGVFPAALVALRTVDWERIEAVRAQVGSLVPAAAGGPS